MPQISSAIPRPYRFRNLLFTLTILAVSSNLAASGHLRSFGIGINGELGIGDGYVDAAEPFASNVAHADVSDGSLFYIDTQGRTWAAGDNSYGQLGIGKFKRFVAEPVALSQTFESVIANTSRSTFFLKKNGDLYISGYPPNGFLTPQTGRLVTPIKVLGNVKKVAPSRSNTHHVTYLLTNGELLISRIGYNHVFGIPPDTNPDELSDDLITIDTDVEDAIFTGFNIIILRKNGTLLILGRNFYDPDQEPLYPKTIDTNVLSISPWGTGGFSYLRPDGAAFLWFNHTVFTLSESGVVSTNGMQFEMSDGTKWQLDLEGTTESNGSSQPEYWSFLEFLQIEEFEEVSVSAGLISVLNHAGNLYLKGSSSLVAGVRPTRDSNAPNNIDSGVTAVSVSSETSLYLKDDGSLWGMGNNQFGQISSDSIVYNLNTPVLLMENVVEFDAAQDSSFVIDEDQTLWGFGRVRQYASIQDESEVGRIAIDTGVIAVDGMYSSVAYVTEGGDLWLLGESSMISSWDDPPSDPFTEPQLVATGVTLVENTGDALFWVDTNKKLWASPSALPQGTVPTVVAEAVNSISGSDSEKAVIYITESGELWSFGSSYFNDEDRTTPVLIDTDVVKARSSRNYSIYYQKEDGTLWYRGGVSSYGSQSISGPVPHTSAQRFKDETVIDFDTSRHHFLIVTGDSPLPAIVEQTEDYTIELGDTAGLSIETTGGLSGYIWYEGQPEDRSKPLRKTQVNRIQFTPLESATYWVEAYNTAGTVASDGITVTVNGSLNGSYLDWADWWSIPAQIAGPNQNADFDTLLNYQEFALASDPTRVDSTPFRLGFDPNEDSFFLTRIPNQDASNYLTFRFSSDLETWMEIAPQDLEFKGATGGKFWIRIPEIELTGSKFASFELEQPDSE